MQTLPADAQAMPCISLPAWPIDIVRELTEQRIWLAGGPVRDLILNRVPRDWDFVTDGGALQLARAVANAMGGAFYPLDAARGTGRAVVRDPDTQTPINLDFADLRGSDILDDLRLRDFTINAMASTLDGQFVDPTAGRQDLVWECIRMTSPRAFLQDPARLVRAVRQAEELHFTLEPETHRQLRRDAPAINDVAAERVRAELVRLLRLPAASLGLRRLDELSLLAHILPEVHTVCASPSPADGKASSAAGRGQLIRIGQLIDSVDQLADAAEGAINPASPTLPENLGRAASSLVAALSDLSTPLVAYLHEPVGAEVTRRDLLKWCALFLRTGVVDQDSAGPSLLTPVLCETSASLAEQAMTRLRFSRAAVEFVTRAVGESWRFGRLIGRVPARRQIYAYFRETRRTGVAAALLSLANTVVAQSGAPCDQEWAAQLDVVRPLLDAYLRQRDAIVDPQPLLSGNDMMALGLNPGPRIGELIEALREAQAAGEVLTRSEAETWAAGMIAAQ
jgi:tRNA nucleotidyltransferase/poly(A) polymerase